MKKKVLIAMSGGVDSSAAALLLQKQGYECAGATLSLCGNETDGAKRIADGLGMPFYIFDEHELFAREVMDHFVSEYRAGRTPNPCIDCNRFMKFDKLFERARLLGCDHVATGHYARIEEQNGKFILKKALDASKDQSYVLYTMTQEQLAHTLFPLGALPKTQTRAIAEEAGFWNAHKPDSQDICFVPDGDYAAAIERLTGEKSEPGDFVDRQGHVLGRHGGIIRYTVGQHRGLGLGQSEKRYVCALCPEENTVVLGGADELFSRTALVSVMNWISGEAPALPFRCSAKTRYRQPEQPCTVYPAGEAGVRLVFDEPLRAITPGQSAVLYDGDTVLGGGIIAREESVC